MNFKRKPLINDVSKSVRDQLTGLVSFNDHLALFETINVVVRKDFIENVIKSQKVILLSGGGSGHEPSHTGLIGNGLITAAVFGNIFASPPANLILAAIRELATSYPTAPILMIVPNYTGDRLNFGLAQEKALNEGFKVDSFVFGEDAAFGDKKSKAGKRGLAGIFFIHKLAGAMANQGKSLDEIKAKLDMYASKIATISISSSACTIPGVGLSFTLPKDKLEIGLGIHGEKGSTQIDHCSATSVVEQIMPYLIEHVDFIKNRLCIDQYSMIPIALLINNLGGLSWMEVNIISKEVVNYLSQRQFKIERTFCGSFVTSFDMAGVSVSIMMLNQESLYLLDEPCSSICFSKNESLTYKYNSSFLLPTIQQMKSKPTFKPLKWFVGHEKKFFDCTKAACLILIENEKLLNQLDSESGDSDCGSTLTAGAKLILSKVSSGQLETSFIQMADQLENVMGGSSGALYSLFFTGADNYIKNTQFKDDLSSNVSIWIQTLQSATHLVSKYSYAQVGDRTMIDTLHAVVMALKKSQSLPLPEILNQVIEASKEAADQTAFMKPRVGRASYSDSEAVNKPDPGAYAVHLWMKAICQQLK